MTYEERAYQVRAFNAARAAFAGGKRAVLLVAPTGAGKTTVASMIAEATLAKRKRLVFLAHRDELIDQAAKRFRSFGMPVGVRGTNIAAPIQVTSPQTILARRTMPEGDLVILDEAHHYAAASWGEIMKTYLVSGSRCVGLTATPDRGDGLGLGGPFLFDHLEVVAQIPELVDLGWLVPCQIVDPIRDVRALALDPWDAYRQFGEDRSAVVFAPHVKAAQDFARDFNTHGISADVVHGDMDSDDRARVLASYARGEIRVVCNVMVLTEGWDCPRAKVCILARLVGSPSLYLQMVGRVLRPEYVRARPGEYARLIDLAGNVVAHGRPDEPRRFSLIGQACSRLSTYDSDGVRRCQSCHAEIPDGEMACPDCGTPLPVLRTPNAEAVALALREKEEREAAKQKEQERRRALAEDKRVRMLATLYVKGIRNEWQRKAAHMSYRGLTGRFPDKKLMANAWLMANDEAAAERGDAYEPPIVREKVTA